MARAKNPAQAKAPVPMAEQVAPADHEPIDEMGAQPVEIATGVTEYIDDAARSPDEANAESADGHLLEIDPASEIPGEILTRVAVRVKKPHTHRRRAGMAFGQQPQTVSVTADVLDALVNDPLLIVEEV